MRFIFIYRTKINKQFVFKITILNHTLSFNFFFNYDFLLFFKTKFMYFILSNINFVALKLINGFKTNKKRIILQCKSQFVI